nr:hypothetical protein [Microbacterium pseudoresistens]
MPVTVQSGPTEGDEGDSLTHEGWTPDDAVTAPRRARKEPTLAPWALLAAIVALVTSFFVGWGIPVAIIAVIAAIMALRTPSENRAMAVWALVLGGVATLYSAGWLVWAAYRFGWLG